MTNGEKIKETFPNIQIFNIIENELKEKFIHIRLGDVCQAVDLEWWKWWNAEYKEPVIRDNEVKDELNRVKDELEPTTKKDCNTCTHSNETDGSNCYECVKDMCNNYDPTTKNDLGVEEVTALAEWTTAYSQGYADGVKSVNICPYCGEYIGEEE